MRRLLLVGIALVGLVAIVALLRTRQGVPASTSVEGPTSAPVPARIMTSAAPPLSPTERLARTTTLHPAARESSAPNEARFEALQRAIVTTTPEAARLYSDFAKAGIATPPQARALVKMKDDGTSHDHLVAYVKTSFPNDVIARAVALRWLGAGSGARLSPQTSSPRALGELTKGDAN